MTFFSEDHDDVVCKICKTLKHKTCKVVELKDKHNEYDKGKLTSLLSKLKEPKLRNDKYMQEQDSALKTVDLTKVTVINEIQEFRKELKSLLDGLEYTSIKELEKEEKQQLNEFQEKLSISGIIDETLKTDIDLEGVLKTNEADSQFAADIKVSNRLRYCFSSFEDVSGKQGTPNLTFKADKELMDFLQTRKNLGHISAESYCLKSSGTGTAKEKERTHERFNASFLDTAFKVHTRKQIKESGKAKEADIIGCEIMPTGDIILCDNANKIVLGLNSILSVQTSLILTDDLFGVSAVNDTTAAITLPSVKQLQFVDVRPNFRLAKKVQLDKQCWGIQVKNTNIYVSCFNTYYFGRRDGEVRILDLNGSLLRKLGLNENGLSILCHPQYITASSGKVFVTDNWDSTVTCLDVNVKVIYRCKDASLYDLRGICVDDHDNVIVVGRKSNNMLRIDALGKGCGLVLKASDGIKTPQCIAYRRSNNALIVGCYSNPNSVALVMG